MQYLRFFRRRILTIAVILVTANPAFGEIHSLTETFSSLDLCDASNTSAFWDTATGELRLPPFPLQEIGTYDTPGNALGVDVDGDHLFIADDANGLVVLDVASGVYIYSIEAGPYDRSGKMTLLR